MHVMMWSPSKRPLQGSRDGSTMKNARYRGGGNYGGLENNGEVGPLGRSGGGLWTLRVRWCGTILPIKSRRGFYLRFAPGRITGIRRRSAGRGGGLWAQIGQRNRGGIMDDSHTSAATDFMPLRLRLHPGNHIIDLTSPDVLLGRQGNVDLRMPQPDVSREHCRFQFSHGGWRIVDLDSLNGVYVNGARIRRMSVIDAGDQIRICGIEFDVEGPVNAVPVDGPSGVLEHVGVTMPQQTLQRKAG
jgi:hypothetical protein